MNNSTRVAIIGNIAVGKSSVTQLVSYFLGNCVPVAEPLDRCRQTGLFERFYQDKKKYGLEWQKLVVGSRQEDVNQASLHKEVNQMILMDGHMLTDKHVFVKTLWEEGSLSKEEKDQYDAFFNQVIPNCENEVYIYLRCSPEASQARAAIRARNEECGLSLDYLRRLHNNLELFVEQPEIQKKVFIVDVTRLPLGDVAKIVSYILKKVYDAQGVPADFLRVYAPVPEPCCGPALGSEEQSIFVQ